MEKQRIGVGVGVMIIRQGKVLLGKRHSDPTKADSELHGEGTWTMPGGKVEYGEDFEDAGVREVEEETGIILDRAKVCVLCVSNDRVTDAHFVTIGLLYESDDVPEPVVCEPDEIVEWRWFPLDQLPTPLFFPSERVVKNYRNQTFYHQR